MNQSIQSDQYDVLIKKIRRKRIMVIVLTLIALLITVSVCSPTHLVF